MPASSYFNVRNIRWIVERIQPCLFNSDFWESFISFCFTHSFVQHKIFAVLSAPQFRRRNAKRSGSLMQLAFLLQHHEVMAHSIDKTIVVSRITLTQRHDVPAPQRTWLWAAVLLVFIHIYSISSADSIWSDFIYIIAAILCSLWCGFVIGRRHK